MSNSYLELLNKSPKTEAEKVAVISIMQLSTQPKWTHLSVNEIYDAMLAEEKNIFGKPSAASEGESNG